MKKLHGILLGGTLALSVISAAFAVSFEKEPVKASADWYHVFYIGDHDMVANPTYEDGQGGTAVYNESQNKITLTNFHFEGQGFKFLSDGEQYAAFYYDLFDRDLTVELVGDNYLKETSSDKVLSTGMMFEDSQPNPLSTITIQGSGSLTVESSSNAQETYGLYCKYPKLKIKSGNIIAKANVSTVYESCGAHVECFEMTGGNLTAQSLGAKHNSYGIYASSSADTFTFVVSGGNITCIAGDTIDNGYDSIGLYTYYYGYNTSTDGVKITGGSIYAEAGKGTKRSIGIFSRMNKKIAISGGKVEGVGINSNNKEGLGILYYAYNENYVKTLMLSNKAVAKFTGNTYAVGNTPNGSTPSEAGTIINSMEGKGWDNIARTGDPTSISVNTSAAPCAFKAVEFGASATYTQEPTAKTGLAYTGEAQALVNAGTSEQGTVVYRLGDSGDFSATIPTAIEVGTYVVQYKIQGDSSHIDSDIESIEVAIAKPSASFVNEPTAKTDLVYNGEAQALVNAGTSEQGTVVYRLGDSGDFSTTIPTATDAGTYIVQYKILGDTDHSDSEVKSITVTITSEPAPVPPEPGPEPTPSDNNGGFPGWAIALVVIGGTLGLGCLALVALFFFNPRYVVDYTAKKVIRVIYVKKHDGLVLLRDTRLRKIRRNEIDVYKTRSEAEAALKK